MEDGLDRAVLERFVVLDKLATGAYGIVWKAEDKITGELVAIKKIFDAFENEQDAQRTYREISYLKIFRGNEGIVELMDVILASNKVDIFLVFEFLETNLHAVIREKALAGFPDRHFAWITYQILKALKYLHSGGVVHRDIKPGNVLMTQESEIKLCDFGFARSLHQKSGPPENRPRILTDYVSTRWYRAPELLLGSTDYTLSVDLWAVGCVLAEMLRGEPLFPGESTTDQIKKIVAITGRPTVADIAALNSSQAVAMLESLNIFPSDGAKDVGEKAALTPRSQMTSLEIIRALHAKQRQDSSSEDMPEEKLKSLIPNASDSALSFISALLSFNPEKRPTVEQALDHPYIRNFRDSMAERTMPSPVLLKLSDDIRLSIQDYRSAVVVHESEESPASRDRTRSRPAFPLSPFNAPEHRRLSTGQEFEDPRAPRRTRSPVRPLRLE